MGIEYNSDSIDNKDENKEGVNPIFTVPNEVKVDMNKQGETDRNSFGYFLGSVFRALIVLAVIAGVVWVSLKYLYPEFKKLAQK